MAKYKLQRKVFTVWDETDNLKRMKDSDILAEKRKPIGYGGMIRSAATGAAMGAGVMGAVGGIKGIRAGGAWRGMKIGGASGALIGGATGFGLSYLANRKRIKDNKIYNRRLQYAQGQALRRERRDWKTNMTQRDGYSY
jgi:hypothetical protein